MFRCFFAFLLISTYSGSSGAPTNTGDVLISSLLESLLNRCPNEFLSQQIKAHLEECKVNVPPFNEQEFVCLMFYDINKQLCDAVAQSTLSLVGDYSNKINKDFDVETACAQAKSWSISDLQEIPDYKTKVNRVFTVHIGCIKVCGVAEVTSQDTNYFCKYLKWGSNTLSTLHTTTKGKNDEVTANTNLTLNENKLQSVSTQVSPIIPGAIKDNVMLPAISNNNTQMGIKTANTSEIAKPIVVNGSETSEVSGKPILQQIGNQDFAPFIEEPDKALDIEIKTPGPERSAPASQSAIPSNNGIDNSGGDLPLKKEEIEQTVEDSGNKAPLKNPQDIAKPKPGDIDPDYQDSEEGNPETDDTDAGEPEGVEVENKIDDSQDMKHPKLIEIPKSFNGEREFGPSITQEQFETDDDHFFPFFLTAVILVVLLYVLYHNKSKVSKVVLGLIVEGRQPGRRRNSRGHAYKRLDTLEQAMSTSSTAPPSKIIY